MSETPEKDPDEPHPRRFRREKRKRRGGAAGQCTIAGERIMIGTKTKADSVKTIGRMRWKRRGGKGARTEAASKQESILGGSIR